MEQKDTPESNNFYNNVIGQSNKPEMVNEARKGQKSQNNSKTFADLARSGGKVLFASKQVKKL